MTQAHPTQAPPAQIDADPGAAPDAITLDVVALTPEYAAQAAHWAARLNLPLRARALQDADAGNLTGQVAGQLQIGPAGLQLRLPLAGAETKGASVPAKASAMGIVRVDFLSGAAAHRRQFGGGSGQMIARAIGLQPGVRPAVLDATAGLGRDAFVLAQLGCPLRLIERHPVIAALLEDGLRRAAEDAGLAPIVARMRLSVGEAITLMRDWHDGREETPQVVYLDPMFPHRQKSALVKKEMRLLRPLTGNDADAPALLAAALDLASHRVVVKRPRQAPPIVGQMPGYALNGQSCRFDVYPKKSLKPA